MAHPTAVEISSSKSRKTALLLCVFGGWAGLHKLYVGDFGQFFMYLCTLGIFGIFWILDTLSILFGFFKDKAGFRLLNW